MTMIFARGSKPVPGWIVRFPVKDSVNAETYRVISAGGDAAFLKVLHAERLSEDRFGLDGYPLEVTISKSLSHERIPSVLQSGTLGGPGGLKYPYLLLDLIPGETLGDRLSREVALAPAFAYAVMRELLETVTYLHQLPDPVYHNELAPSNVLLDVRNDPGGRPVLIDYGLARRASDSVPANLSPANPFHLANECFERPVSSAAADVFALGATYYRMLFGLPPWDLGVSQYQALQQGTREALLEKRRKPLRFPNSTLYGRVGDTALMLIKRAMSARPEDRFEDAAAFLAALDEKKVPTQSSNLGPGPSPSSKSPQPLCTRRGFDRVAGMSELKQTLTTEVIKPLRDRERYARFRLSIPNGLLLWGPPGCGKTFVAECFGEELGFGFRKVFPSDVASIYIHGTQEKIKALFDAARRDAPCVLFLDEFDAMVPARNDVSHSSYATEVNEWLGQMNNIGKHDVFLMAATNQLALIDSAITRTGRIDKTIYIGPPDFVARKAMFELYLVGRPIDGTIDAGELAGLTRGRVSSDIKALVDAAARTAITAGAPAISMSHLAAAIAENRPSVRPQQIRAYEEKRKAHEDAGSASKRIGF